MGGVNDLFTLRFTVFRAFRALGTRRWPVYSKIHSMFRAFRVWGV